MKKIIFPIAGIALLLASCETNTNDSYQTIPYPECNLIIDNDDLSKDAQISTTYYNVKFNLSQSCIDIQTSELTINNQRQLFETDTMALYPKYFKYTYNGKEETGTKLTFSKKGATAIGSSASNLSGAFVVTYYREGDVANPNFQVLGTDRLDMRYTLSDRYTVQTFWPTALFLGQNVATSEGISFASNNANYLTQIDFEKKTASVYLYNAQFSADTDKELPRVILFEGIPVKMTHDDFYLESAAPTTKVLGKKNNLTAMVDSVGFAATDFSLNFTSSDLTEISISYKLDGKSINFRGCSTPKSGF